MRRVCKSKCVIGWLTIQLSKVLVLFKVAWTWYKCIACTNIKVEPSGVLMLLASPTTLASSLVHNSVNT